MTTVREPVRRDVVSLSDSPESQTDDQSIRAALAFVMRNKRAYGSVFIGFALLATASYGFFTWTPSFLIRTYGWEASNAGYAFGLMVLSLGTGGTLLGGILADRALAKGRLDAKLRVSMYAGAGMLLSGCLAPLMPSAPLAFLFLAPTVVFLGVPVGLAPAACNFITPNQLRGQVIALYLFAVNLLGLGFGPTIVAVITDYGFGDPGKLRYSLSVFAVVISASAVLSLLWGINAYRARARVMLGHDQAEQSQESQTSTMNHGEQH
jgi:MFS family permease